jgi:signal transduction histidine kinase
VGALRLLRRPRRSVRLTLRLRLTLLYGSVFLAAGAGLLTATYLLFTHSQAAATRTQFVHGGKFVLPTGLRPPLRITANGGRATVRAYPSGAAGRAQVPAGEAYGTVLNAPGATVLFRQIATQGQHQLAALARLANVRLRRQQSQDAASLLEWSAIALAAVALLSVALAWWLAGRALSPLRLMNARAREISAENLHERLGVTERRDELGELAGTFDALLARLEGAFDSQRRFVANASHELRTPITLERTLVEVALADPDASVESLRRVCERVVASTEEQERLLDALLTLARSEAGVAAGEEVDLATLVRDALLVREVRLQGLSLECALDPCPVVGDGALLERLVGNLLDNAIIHNGGSQRWIRIATGQLDGAPGLRIANGGPPLNDDRVASMFEPFWRGTGERLGFDQGGLGLGLSIVRAVADAHGAEIVARPLAEGGIAFELRFASAAAAKPPVGGLETVTA